MNKTTIDYLQKIQDLIYNPLYDDLTTYLKGMRDLLNLINNVDYVNQGEILDYVLNELRSIKKWD